MENGQKRSSFTWIWTRATWGKQKSREILSKALPLSHGGFLQYMCRNSKVFLQIASIHYYDTMNTMQYSRICENIDFFLILSLDIGFDLLFWFIYMYFNL